MLRDKIALITGGGAGMGAATARLFAANGARVAIADVDESASHKTISDIQQAGHEASFIHMDVSNPAQVEATVQTVVDQYGRLDVAVNNAAIAPDVTPLVELDLAQWDRMLGINLTGVAVCLKFQLQQLVAQGTGGSIVNISSVRGFRGKANAAAYVASKHGVVGLTKVAAMEHGADNIRVNSVAPGATDTPMLRASLAKRTQENPDAEYNPSPSLLNRFGTAEEVAQASLWLASDQSSFLTGTTIHADGGFTAS